MNREEVSQIIFDETHTVSPEATVQRQFRRILRGAFPAGGLVDIMTKASS
jgi:hypothetical protein